MSPFGWALLAALCWGFAPILEKTGLRGAIDPTVSVFIRSIGVLLGAAAAIPFFPRLVPRLAAIPPRNWLFLLAGGLLASIFGQVFFYRALQSGEVSRVVPIGAAYPLIACLLGILLWNEPVTITKTAGILFVFVGIFLLR